MDGEARKRTGEQAKMHKQLQCQGNRKNIIYAVQTQLSLIKYNELHVSANKHQTEHENKKKTYTAEKIFRAAAVNIFFFSFVIRLMIGIY
jgi:hypothetical protein